ncbi:hypothetical protein AGMMS49938_08160 [Fibrobacterales bacterium]|nr:hypothetical protein AGMMS49938_08160 [Fibrobacterales bacterium]
MMTRTKQATIAAISTLIIGGATFAQAADEVPVVNAGGTKISLYGFLQLNAAYEDGNNGGKVFSYTAPSKSEDGNGRFLMNVNQTRIGFNLAGPQKDGEPEVSGKFESDFANSNDRNNNGVGGFRIRQSYGQVKFKEIGLTLLMGQAADLISPLSPSTINQGSANYAGNLGTRRPQIRLTESLGAVELAVAALDDRGAAIPTAPAVQGRAGVKVPASWAGEKQNLAVGISGHFAKEKNADTLSNQPYEKKPKSWSVNADLSLPITGAINLAGEFFYGQDLKNYSNGSIGLTPAGEDGIKSLGGWGALGFKLPANISLYGGAALEAIDSDSEVEGKPSQNLAVFANLGYNFTSSAKIALEYFRIATDYADKGGKKVDSGTLNRVEAALTYSFN